MAESMREPLSVDCRQALERAGALLVVEGSAVLRAQAQQQAALELLQARKLGATDRELAEVLVRRIRAAVTELVGTVQPSVDPRALAAAMAEPQPALTGSSPDPPAPPASSTPLLERAEALVAQLAAEPSLTGLEPNPWSVAVACHQRMLALADEDRIAGIAHAVAGARVVAGLRQREVSLPDWLVHHEEQLCRYGGLWIHERLLVSGQDHGLNEGGALARQGVTLLTRLQQIHNGRHAWIGQHLAALQQHLVRCSAGRPLTIVVAGNCQFWPLFQALKVLLPDAHLEAGLTVHLATPEEVEAFHRLLAGVDVLLIHRIQPGYRHDIGLENRTLAGHLPPGGRQLLLPNIHYEGHHPWIGYAHDPQGQLAALEASSPLGPYHDFLAMQAAARGLSAQDILAAPLHPEIADRIRQHHQHSLEQLRRREIDCAVEISSWIERNHRRVPVSHTCNHPTQAALEALLRRLLEHLEPGAEIDTARLERREYLGALSIPILPWVRQALELEDWAASWGLREGTRPFPIEAQLAASIAFYREHPWIAEQNQQQEKFQSAAAVLETLSSDRGSAPG